MRYPWANVVLLLLLLAQAVTGYLGFVTGVFERRWILWWHGLGAYAVVLLLYWKGSVILNVWRRGRRWSARRLSFALLLVLLLATLITGTLWSFSGPIYVAGFSLISLHIYLAVPLLLLLGWHFWHMRWVLTARRTRQGRRAWLRAGLLQLGGLALWLALGRLKDLTGSTGTDRRFTGSYEAGSFSPFFPVTSWINDRPRPVDAGVWRLGVQGAVDRALTLTYDELLTLADTELVATLDCTGGFFTTQRWQGVPLGRLLDLAGLTTVARSVTVRSITGYHRRFTLAEAQTYLLATHVAGAALDHGHGFPARLVAPDKRGYAWVKWVTAVQVNRSSVLWQPPLPLQ